MVIRKNPIYTATRYIVLMMFVMLAFLNNASLIAQHTLPSGGDALTSVINQNFQNRSHLFEKPLTVDDATFARRVAIDLTGMPLSTDQLRKFMADSLPDKRTKLVDQLLASPQSTRHLATWLSLTLLERRPAKIANDDIWMAYLMDIIRHDKPLTDITRDLLTATGEEGPKQVAARFLMDRDAEPNLMTRDIGRIFLGRDMQCNQCHDHPLVDGYLQSDYQSLLAFMQPTSVATVKNGNKQLTLLSEKSGGRVLFDSVFVKDDSLLTGPSLPCEKSASVSRFQPGDEYLRRQSESSTSLPRQSRRALLAESILASPVFAKNWANRIWAFAFGRGLVHPLDFSHPENPPVDAKLLEDLAESFKSNGYRIRPVLKAIILSNAYQSPFDLNDSLAPAAKSGDIAEMKSELDRLTIESEKLEEAFNKAKTDWHKAQAATVPVQKNRDALQAKLDEHGGKRDAAILRLEAISARLGQILTQIPTLNEAKIAAEKTVATIPGDKALEAALKTFTDRIAEFVAEQNLLIEDQGKKAVERRTAEEQLAAVRFQAKAVENDLAPLIAEVSRLELPFLSARSAMDSKISEISSLKNEIYWQETRNGLIENRSKLNNLNFQIAQLEPISTSTRSELEQAKVSITNLQKASDSQKDALNVILLAYENQVKETEKSRLAESAMKRSLVEFLAAAKLLDGSADLAEIQVQLQAKSDQLQAQFNQKKVALDELTTKQNATKVQLEVSLSQLKMQTEAVKALAEKSDRVQAELAELLKQEAQVESSLNTLTETLIRLASERFEMATLKPLGPESFAWSIMKTTGVYDNYWKAEEAALDKAQPTTDAQKADQAWQMDRSYAIEMAVYNKLKGYPNHFVTLYGSGAGQPQSEFFATADQALYVANGGAVASWCMPSSGNTADGILKAKSQQEAADALYMGVLGRKPDSDEIQTVSDLMAKATDKTRATMARDLVWGLLTSPEYRFNH